jgi:branched-chain amino acid transport system substrate-binding protein
MTKLLLRALAAVSICFASPAFAQVKIGVIVSATGPVSQIGIQHKNAVPLLDTQVGNTTIEYIVRDDASDPTQTTKIAQKMLIEDKVDAIIGPSGTPNALAIIRLVAEAKTPLIATVGSAAVVLPMDDKKRWVFKTPANDDLMASAIVGHMQAANFKKVAVIATSDPFGENWAATFRKLAEKANMTVVAEEKYARSDSSVTAQALKIKAAAPEAVLVASAGAPAVLPEITLVDMGYRGKVYQTHGAGTPDFITLGGAKVENTVMAVSPLLAVDELPNSYEIKSVAVAFRDKYIARYNTNPGTFPGHSYDAGLLLANAIPKALATAVPGTEQFREALRSALEATKEFKGTQGVYNMTPEDHSGLDQRGRILVEIKNGKWTAAQ